MNALETNEHFIVVKQAIPRIASMIELHWGYNTLESFIFGLLNDSRDGAREGFPMNVASALFKLTVLHAELFPSPRQSHTPQFSQSHDVWSAH
jgi:hypothetical protein